MPDERFGDAESLFQRLEPRFLLPRFRCHILGLEAVLLKIRRRFWTTVIGGEYDQGVIQPDFLVDVLEKGGQGPVEP